MIDYIIIGVVIVLFAVGIVTFIKSRKKGGCAGCSHCSIHEDCDHSHK